MPNHIKHVHTGETHLCSKCPFNSKNSGTLRKHFKFAHTSWKESCEFCGKIVKDLKVHLGHTMCGRDVDDRKGLRCPQCNSMQFTNIKLQRHIKTIHEGLKDKTCPNCSYKTYSSFNLKMHISNVHEKTKFIRNCPHCDIKSGNLERHIRLYHNDITEIDLP